MKMGTTLSGVLIGLMVLATACGGPSPTSKAVTPGTVITFNDPGLAAPISRALGKGPGVEKFKAGELAGLTRLRLGWPSEPVGNSEFDDYDNPRGRTLPFPVYEITDLSQLTYLPNLKILTIGGFHQRTQIDDISGLANISQLTTLILNAAQISDISPFANLTNLETLHLPNNYISDLSPLANLTNLSNLSLRGNQLNDLTPLAALTNLTVLDLSSNQMNFDLSPLASLTNLTDFSFSQTGITDISFLNGLPQLERLNIRANQITDISPLANLTRLTSLNIERNRIRDLSPLLQNGGLGAGDTGTSSGSLSPRSRNIRKPGSYENLSG